jgi:hypothetical protein
LVGILKCRPYLTSVLDYGAGKGLLGDFIRKELSRELHWINYDPGVPAYDKVPEGQFDLVVTSDVLEHVEPPLLKETIQRIADRAKLVMVHDVPCTATGKIFSEGPYKGQDMHLTVESPKWWRKLIRESLGPEWIEYSFQAKERLRKGEHVQRVQVVYERI